MKRKQGAVWTWVFCFLSILGFLNHLEAQGIDKKNVQRYFEAGKFQDVYETLKEYRNLEDKALLYMRGVSAYHIRSLNQAILDLSALSTFEDTYKNDVFLILGHALLSAGRYEDAAAWYKAYLSELDRDAQEERAEVVHRIKLCKTGLKAAALERKGFVENMGKVVNSGNNEVFPCQSPNHFNKYYFSSNRPGSTGGKRDKDRLKDEVLGEFYYDLYSVKLEQGNWSSVEPLHPLINSSASEFLLDFSKDGSVLYYMKSGDHETGQILTDTFRSTKDLSELPDEFYSPVDGSIGDQYLHFLNERMLIFASKRKGGFGGYDLYYSSLNDGLWSPAINLGPQVNTKYDEISPYFTHSGTMLFFSSNREGSIGGYDIFQQAFSLERNEWQEAETMNMPINSPDDDFHFSLSKDGTTGVFSSNRMGGIGGYDLYLVYLKQAIENIPKAVIDFEALFENARKKQKITMDKASKEAIERTIPQKEVVLSPLYFGDKDELFTEDNLEVLSILIDVLKVYPKTTVSISGHGEDTNGAAFQLFFSIKRAEQIAQYLIKKGIQKERISLQGMGNKFPIAIRPPDRSSSELVRKLNNRIDLDLFHVDPNYLKITYQEPFVADYLKNPSYYKYREIKKEPYFKLKVAETSQMYRDPILESGEVCVVKDKKRGTYIYYVGMSNSYLDIKKQKSALSLGQYPGIEIQLFKNDLQVSDAGLEQLAETNPEIATFKAEKNN